MGGGSQSDLSHSLCLSSFSVFSALSLSVFLFFWFAPPLVLTEGGPGGLFVDRGYAPQPQEGAKLARQTAGLGQGPFSRKGGRHARGIPRAYPTPIVMYTAFVCVSRRLA